MKRSPLRRLAYRMAVMSGEVDVDAMLRRITAKQFRGWEAYYELEPFGAQMDSYRFASVVQAIRNVLLGKDQTPYTIEECLVTMVEKEEKKAEVKKEQPWEHKLAVAMMIATVYGQSKEVH